jgi:hypothetical protein
MVGTYMLAIGYLVIQLLYDDVINLSGYIAMIVM